MWLPILKIASLAGLLVVAMIAEAKRKQQEAEALDQRFSKLDQKHEDYAVDLCNRVDELETRVPALAVAPQAQPA